MLGVHPEHRLPLSGQPVHTSPISETFSYLPLPGADSFWGGLTVSAVPAGKMEAEGEELGTPVQPVFCSVF